MIFDFFSHQIASVIRALGRSEEPPQMNERVINTESVKKMEASIREKYKSSSAEQEQNQVNMK